MSVATEIVGFSCAGLGLGYLGWKKLGLPSWVVAIGALAGLIVALVRVKKEVDVLNRKPPSHGT